MSDNKTDETHEKIVIHNIHEGEDLNTAIFTTIFSLGIGGLIMTTIFIGLNGLWMSSLTSYMLISSAIWFALKALVKPEELKEVTTVAMIAIPAPAGLLILGKFAIYVYNFAYKWDFPIF